MVYLNLVGEFLAVIFSGVESTFVLGVRAKYSSTSARSTIVSCSTVAPQPCDTLYM